MSDQNQPKVPAFNPKLKDAIVALKAENNPKNLNAVLNELVRSPLLAPANFDLQGQSAPTPGPDGRVQLPPNTKINLIMVNSPEGKHYYLGFSDWDAVHAWQKNPEQGRQVIMLRFDDFANMVSKNPDASGMVINPGENSLRLEKPLIESVKKTKDEVSQKIAAQLAEQQARRIHPGDKVTFCTSSMKRYFVPETASRGPMRASSCSGALTDRYPYRSRSKKTMWSSSTPSALSSSAMHCMRQDLPQRWTPVMTLIIPSSW